MNTDDLIDRLARDSTAVTPLPTASIRTAMWMVWAVLYLVIVAVMMRIAMSAGGVTVTPLYLVQQGAALAIGISAARAALLSVIPGTSTRSSALVHVAAAVWVASVLWQVAIDRRTAGTVGLAAQTDWPCVASMLFGGLVLGGPLVWMVRSGAPLTPRLTAFLIGLAAMSVANIEACLTRPHTFSVTVLLWHGTTIAAAAIVAGLNGRRWFRWPSAVPEG